MCIDQTDHETGSDVGEEHFYSTWGVQIKLTHNRLAGDIDVKAFYIHKGSLKRSDLASVLIYHLDKG